LWKESSEKGFGVVLEQEGSDNVRYPVAYANRPINNAETKCASIYFEVIAPGRFINLPLR